MTTELLKQALEAMEDSRYVSDYTHITKLCQEIRKHLDREVALQRMVDLTQELGLYEEPEKTCWYSNDKGGVCRKCGQVHSGPVVKPFRAVTTTVTDPAAIRAAFEKDSENG